MMHGPQDPPHQGHEAPQEIMAKDKSSTQKKTAKRSSKAAPANAGWTLGLRQLYDSVVEEPLPDSFQDLLSKLDGADR